MAIYFQEVKKWLKLHPELQHVQKQISTKLKEKADPAGKIKPNDVWQIFGEVFANWFLEEISQNTNELKTRPKTHPQSYNDSNNETIIMGGITF